MLKQDFEKQDVGLKDLEFITDLSPSESEIRGGFGCPDDCLCGSAYPSKWGACPKGYKPQQFGNMPWGEHWNCCK